MDDVNFDHTSYYEAHIMAPNIAIFVKMLRSFMLMLKYDCLCTIGHINSCICYVSFVTTSPNIFN